MLRILGQHVAAHCSGEADVARSAAAVEPFGLPRSMDAFSFPFLSRKKHHKYSSALFKVANDITKKYLGTELINMVQVHVSTTRASNIVGPDPIKISPFDPTSSIAKMKAEIAPDAVSVSTSDVTSTTTSTTCTVNSSMAGDIGIGVSDVHPEAELIQDAMAAKSLSHKLDVEPPPYKLPRTRPIVIGHRLSIYEEPENTIPSFQRAIDLGCDGIETDAFVVDCGTVIAFHADDASGNIDEYCGEEGKNIHDYTYDEVADLGLNPDADVLFQCPKEKTEDAQIPEMREALALFKKHRTTVYMELKGPGTEEPTLELVDELDMVEQVVFVSFEEDRLEKIHQLRPERNDDGHYKHKVALLFLGVPEDFIEQA